MPEPNKTINLEDFTILCDIKERLQAITQEQVDLKATRLSKMEEGETQFGIASDLCKRLWTLADILSYEGHMEIAMSGKLADPKIIEDHKQRALIARELHDVANELLWAQSRNDNGYWADVSVAIREGWVLVSCPESGAPPGIEGLMAMIRSKTPGR